MTIVKGQIESLKRIKAALNQNGIGRFKSVGDINDFIKNYELDNQEILDKIGNDLNIEIDALQADRITFQEHYDILKIEETHKLEKKIEDLSNKCNLINTKNTNALIKAFNILLLKILKFKKKRLVRNFTRIIFKKTYTASQKVDEIKNTLNEYSRNREEVISERSSKIIKMRAYTKEVVDSLYPQIAGAIGENLVVNELKKLSDKNILFNDFSIDFKNPIYNKKEDDRILSIQIDHLLITNSGIFIIETKNWSKQSVENFDLRSPINQIRRTSYALFVILNGYSRQSEIALRRHHWGDKQIPIRNLVVMINNKPREKFKYVTVKTLKELNSYISYFDPIFDDSEVSEISNYFDRVTPTFVP